MTTLADPASGGDVAQLRTVARGGALNLVGVVANGLLSFGLVFVLARGLGAAGYGSLSACIGLFMILSNVGELGADTGVLHRLPRLIVHRQRRDIRPVLFASLLPVLAVGVVLAVAVTVFAGQIADLLVRGPGDQATRFLEAMGPFLAVASAMTVLLCALRGSGNLTGYVGVQNIGVPLARPLLALLAIGAGATGFGVALAYAAPLAVGFIVALVLLIGYVRRAEDRATEDAPARSTRVVAGEFWRFAAARGVAGALAITATWVTLLLVSGLRGAHDAGVFGGVMRYVIMGTFAFQASRVVIGPMISRLLAQDKRADTELVFQTATSWLMALSWPYYLLLAVFASAALGVFGASFPAGATALTVLCLAELFDMATGNVTLVLLMGGRSSWNLCNIALGLAVTVGLGVLLIPDHGVLGAAIAWAATIVVENLAAALEVALIMKVKPFGGGFGYAGAAAFACYGLLGLLVALVLGDTLTALVTTAVVGSAGYALLLRRWRRQLRLDVLRAALRGRQVGSAAS